MENKITKDLNLFNWYERNSALNNWYDFENETIERNQKAEKKKKKLIPKNSIN